MHFTQWAGLKYLPDMLEYIAILWKKCYGAQEFEKNQLRNNRRRNWSGRILLAESFQTVTLPVLKYVHVSLVNVIFMMEPVTSQNDDVYLPYNTVSRRKRRLLLFSGLSDTESYRTIKVQAMYV